MMVLFCNYNFIVVVSSRPQGIHHSINLCTIEKCMNQSFYYHTSRTEESLNMDARKTFMRGPYLLAGILHTTMPKLTTYADLLLFMPSCCLGGIVISQDIFYYYTTQDTRPRPTIKYSDAFSIIFCFVIKPIVKTRGQKVTLPVMVELIQLR